MGESKTHICKIADTVAKHVIERAKVGLNKYGVTVEKSDLTFAEWLQHLQDELLDGAIYIEKLNFIERILDCPFCNGEPRLIEPTEIEGYFPDEMPHVTCPDESCELTDWIPIDDWQRRSF